MGDWLGGVDPREVAGLALVSMRVEGEPSGVAVAEFEVTLTDGRTVRTVVTLAHAPMFETLEADVAALNRRLWATRRGRP